MATSPQAIIDAIDLALINELDAGGVKDYAIDGKRLTRRSADELIKLRKHFKHEVNLAARGSATTYAGFDKL